MTREEARKHIKNNLITLHDIDENVIECNDAMGIIDQIFNDHEAQLKAKDELMAKKDEEIERLRVENRKFMEYITLKQLSEPIIFCASCSGKVIKLKVKK